MHFGHQLVVLVSILGTISAQLELVDDAVLRHDGPIYAERLKYTPIDDNVTENYASESIYLAGGMKGAYKLTERFLDSVLKKINYKEFIQLSNDKDIEFHNIDFDHLKQFSGLFALWVFLVLFLVLFPLIGLIVSCCRCCNKCGARQLDRKPDNKNMAAKIWQSAVLLVCVFGLLYCAVAAFGSAEGVARGLDKLPRRLRNGVGDVALFFDNTMQQMNVLLETNFKEFTLQIHDSVDKLSQDLEPTIDGMSIDEAATSAENLSKSINDVKTSINDLTTSLGTFAARCNTSHESLKKIINGPIDIPDGEIKDTLNEWNSVDCPTLDTSLIQKPLDDFQIVDLTNELSQFKTKFATLKTDVKDQINKATTTVNTQLDETAKVINSNLDEVKSTVNEFRSYVVDETKQALDDAQDAIEPNTRYVRAVLYILSCLLLIVCILLVLGMIWGTYGTVPTAHQSQCSSKRVGSRIMIASVGIMFGSAFFLALVALLGSLIGVLPRRAVCDPLLREANYGGLFDLLDDWADFTDFSQMKLSQIVDGCKNNEAVYTAMGLDEKFNLNEILKEANVTAMMEDLQTEIDKVIASVGDLNFYDQFGPKINDFSKAVTGLDLNFDVSGLPALDEVDDLIQKAGSTPALVTELQHFREDLNKTLATVDEITPKLEDTKNKLKQELVENQLPALNTSISKTQANLIESITNLQKTASTFLETASSQITKYLQLISTSVQTNIGKCAPLHGAFQSTLIAGCDHILNPLNTFWFALFWSLVLYIPAIPMAMSLASLYQKRRAQPFRPHLYGQKGYGDAYGGGQLDSDYGRVYGRQNYGYDDGVTRF